MTLNPAYDYHANRGVLPGFVSPAEILLDALKVLVPPLDLDPVEAADRFRRIDGKAYDSLITPYMIEPMLMSTSRRYRAVVFVGSVQSGKTTALVENLILHRMLCRPGDIHVTQMDKESAGRYSRGKIAKMLRECPQLRERLNARGESLGAIYNKEFHGNATLSIGWPVASHLASRDIPLCITTDRDRMGDNIDDEGDILTMMLARNTRFGSRGMSVVESSPGRAILDETWTPTTLHEAPPCGGILGYYNEGTRARYYWRCKACGERFEPRLEHLNYDSEGSPLERARTAYMVCPHEGCGGVIYPGEKHELNQPENGAGWLHEHRDGKRAVAIDHADVREAQYVSYWQMGVIAAYQSWELLVSEILSAEEIFNRTGDEQALKAATNTRAGLPFLSRAMETSLEVSGGMLAERAEFYDLGVAPNHAAFVIIAIDVQPNRFVVSIVAFGEHLEHWLVDRYDIKDVPQGSPNRDRRSLQTNIYIEDWDAIADIHETVVPLAHGAYGLKPCMVIVDSQGAPGSYKNATALWRKKYRQGLSNIFHLYRGVGGRDAPRAKKRQPENQSGKKYRNRGVEQLVYVCANRLKDEVVSDLAREVPGAGFFHLPCGLARDIYDEFAAERRTDEGWRKKPGIQRNESLDLAVMTKAAMIIKGGEKINWSSPPDWALVSQRNRFAVLLDGDGKPVPSTKKSPGKSLARVRAGFLKK